MSNKEFPPMSHPQDTWGERGSKASITTCEVTSTYSLTGRRMSPSRRKLFSGVSSGMSSGRKGEMGVGPESAEHML